MNYWTLNAIFLLLVAIAAVAGGCLGLARMPWRVTRSAASSTVLAVAVTLVVLLVATAMFDNIMIGVGLVGYDPAKISGTFIGIAPLEDFAYAIAAAVLLPSLWVLLARPDSVSDSSVSDSSVSDSPTSDSPKETR